MNSGVVTVFYLILTTGGRSTDWSVGSGETEVLVVVIWNWNKPSMWFVHCLEFTVITTTITGPGCTQYLPVGMYTEKAGVNSTWFLQFWIEIRLCLLSLFSNRWEPQSLSLSVSGEAHTTSKKRILVIQLHSLVEYVLDLKQTGEISELQHAPEQLRKNRCPHLCQELSQPPAVTAGKWSQLSASPFMRTTSQTVRCNGFFLPFLLFLYPLLSPSTRITVLNVHLLMQ